MLIWMRNSTFAGTLKFILMGFLLLATAGLVFSDAGGFFRSGFSSGTVIKGGGINVGYRDFDKTVRRVLASRGVSAEEAYSTGLIDTIATSEINSRLFSDKAYRLGLNVSDADIMAQIDKIAAPLARDGMSKKDALLQILRTQNISESEFIGSIRQEIGNTLLRAAIQPSPSLASPLLADVLYRYDNETRSVDYIVLANAAIKDVKPATQEQIQKYYDANKMDFLIPGTRSITIATLTPASAKSKAVVTDDDVAAEYNKNIESFATGEKRRVVMVVSESEEKAKESLGALKDGKSVSGSIEQDFEKNGLPDELATPLFAAKKGDVVGPVQSPLGWHVLKLVDVIAAQTTPLAQIKDKIRHDLEQAASADAFYKVTAELEDRAASGEDLTILVKEYGLTTKTIQGLTVSGMSKDGKDMLSAFSAGDRQTILSAANDTDENSVSSLQETSDGNVHLVQVDKVVADSYRPFADVKSDLEKRWMDEQRALANKAKALSIQAALNDGKSLTDIAKENDATVKSIKDFARTQIPPEPFNPFITAQLFTSDVGKAFSAQLDTGYLIGETTGIKIPTGVVKTDDKSYGQLLDLSGQALSQDALMAFLTSLSHNKKIQINQDLLMQLYGPKEAQQ